MRSKAAIKTDTDRKVKGYFYIIRILYRENFGFIILNLTFILACLPIITIPAAITAMTRIEIKMLKGEPTTIWHDFWQTLKSEFFVSLKCGLVLAVFALLTYVMIGLVSNSELPSLIQYGLLMFYLVVLMMLTIVSGYVFASISILDLPVRDAFRNAIILMIARIHYNFLAFVIIIVLYAISFLLFPLSAPVIVLILFSLSNLILVYNSLSGLERHIIKK